MRDLNLYAEDIQPDMLQKIAGVKPENGEITSSLKNDLVQLLSNLSKYLSEGFNCTICGKTDFPSYVKLKSHMRTRNNENTYQNLDQ